MQYGYGGVARDVGAYATRMTGSILTCFVWKMVQLDYSQHSFTVYFSTLDYSAIVPPRFTYQLQGYDKGWSVPSVLPWGTYKNLPLALTSCM